MSRVLSSQSRSTFDTAIAKDTRNFVAAFNPQNRYVFLTVISCVGTTSHNVEIAYEVEHLASLIPTLPTTRWLCLEEIKVQSSKIGCMAAWSKIKKKCLAYASSSGRNQSRVGELETERRGMEGWGGPRYHIYGVVCRYLPAIVRHAAGFLWSMLVCAVSRFLQGPLGTATLYLLVSYFPCLLSSCLRFGNCSRAARTAIRYAKTLSKHS